jgi:C4-dicarboxylate transporter
MGGGGGDRSRPEAIVVDGASRSAGMIVAAAVKSEYQYAKLGLALGLASIIAGTILGLHGVTGATSWTAKVLGLESKINDAAPGVVLFIVGIFYVWITKPKIKLKDIQ